MAHKKYHDNDHADPKVAEMDAHLAKLAKRIRKADSKKERKVYQAEFDALDAKRTERLAKPAQKADQDEVVQAWKAADDAAVKARADDAGEPRPKKVKKGSKATALEPAEQSDQERADYVAARKYLAYKGHPGQPSPDDIDRSDPDLVQAYNLVIGTLTGHYITSDAEKAEMDARLKESDAETKERVKAKRAAREAVADDVEHDAKVTPIETAKGKKKGVDTAPEADQSQAGADAQNATALADPEPEIPRDRWGRPQVTPVGGGKPVGYRRVTTFIDVIDDKTTLTNWGRRVVMAGVAAVEQKAAGDETVVSIDEVGAVSIVDRVVAANRQLAATVRKADKALAKGKLTETEHAQAHDDAEKAHKTALDDLVQEAFTAGDGFVKAETGTRIHKLTELYDKGEKLPDDTTPSEFRDIEAYAEACKALNVEVQAVEQFVVVDEFQTAGTLDRRIRYDSPTLGRRITGIGDVKTGRVDYGGGKMTRQLAAYAMGKGYDFSTGERQTFRTNREVGLIFHIPAGSGICTVYEIDLKKGLEGLKLCAAIYAHRDETKTPKVFTEVAKSDMAKEAE